MKTYEVAKAEAKAIVAKAIKESESDSFNKPRTPHFTIGWLSGMLENEIVKRLMKED